MPLKRLLPLVILGFLFFAPHAFAAPAFVQSTSTVSYFRTAATTVNDKFGSSVTEGDAIIVTTGWAATTGNLTGVTDSCGDTYTTSTLITGGGGGSYQLAYALNVTGGSACSVTSTISASESNVLMTITEVSGIATTNALDVTTSSQAAGSGTNGVYSGIFRTTANNDFVFGSVWSPNQNGASTVSAGTGYTLRVFNNGSSIGLATEDQVQSSLGNNSTTFSTTGFYDYVLLAAAFKPSGGSAAPPPVVYWLQGVFQWIGNIHII